ncbi:MAG: S1/P1 nuclease [Deltaproteobacteria bacterium]|nr:S1/P1 nuclease [Deltaproteobacteria bacterium]
MRPKKCDTLFRMKKVTSIVCLLFACFGAFGWNDMGHMTVAAIAWQNLTPAARTKVSQLLQLNPSYSTWTANVTDASLKDEVAFIMAATWPDAIKTTPGYTNDGDRPSGSAASQNIGYSDKLQHRYFHFIDLPFSTDSTALEQPVAPNAKTQIAVFRGVLASAASSNDVKSYDLVWLEHMIGDVHQPLHATSRFDKVQPHGDRGGNLVSLCSPPCKDELHGFWDGLIGTSKDPMAARKAGGIIKTADPAQAKIADEAVWIQESFDWAKKSVYIAPVGAGAGPYTLDSTYTVNARKLATQRVALAGARLANLINTALK